MRPSFVIPSFLKVVLLVLLCMAMTTTGAPAAAPPFRCLRPFSSMDSFVAVAKADASQNCNFHYFTVTDASAELRCATTGDSLHSSSSNNVNADDTASCNVTVRWSMRRADDVEQLLRRQVGTDADYFAHHSSSSSSTAAPVTQRQRETQVPAGLFATDDDDVWRYAVSLRAKGDSTVQYKGFHGGDGYSMCCDCIHEADCAWMAADQGDHDLAADEDVNPDFTLSHHRILRSCPLPLPSGSSAEDDGDDEDGMFGAMTGLGTRVVLTDLDETDSQAGREEGVFHGTITKPLHRLVEGPWEVTVQMWRSRQRRSITPNSPAGVGAGLPGDNGVEAEVLGRVVVPFVLNFAELQKAGRVQHVASMALMVEDVVEVTATPAPPATNAAEDDTNDL